MFNPQTKVLYHLDRVVDFINEKIVDPINVEIDHQCL